MNIEPGDLYVHSMQGIDIIISEPRKSGEIMVVYGKRSVSKPVYGYVKLYYYADSGEIVKSKQPNANKIRKD